MSGQRLTDAQIAAALRAHLPERAVPGLRMRVMETVESTAQQRPVPIFSPLFDADPMARRRMLLFAAALLLAAALAGVVAVGAWRLLNPSPTPEFSLDPPSNVPGFVDSVYQRLPELPPVAITTLEDGGVMGKTYVDRSGAVRIERYATADATEPETYRILSGSRVAELAIVESGKVWLDQPDGISEDPRVFLLAYTTPKLARGPGCMNIDDGSAAAGWRYVGLEYVVGRPTHHVACPGADLWIDIETALIMRTRGPAVDDAGNIVPDAFRTIEVTALAFGDQPAHLFEFVQPQGVALMSDQDYQCTLDPLCGASPVPVFTPPPGTSPAPLPSQPSRLSDNGWIAYVTYPTIGGDGPSDIYLVREGVAPKLLVGGGFKQGHNSCPAFSPDGTWLAYATAGDGPEYDWVDPAIVVVEVDDAGSTVGDELRIRVNGGLACPKWSADGRSLAYSANDELTVTRLGGETTVIAPPTAMGPWRDFAWSPVDDVLAAIRPTGIWLIPGDGGEPTLLREAAGELHALSWSPDGARLAITTEIREGDTGHPGPIRIIRVDGTEPDRDIGLSPFERASWSPSGDRIAYTDVDGNVVIADLDGTDPQVVPDVEDPEGRGIWEFGYAFKWSPDGQRFLSLVKREEWAVMSISATGDPDPILMTDESMDLYAARPDDVSWQPLTP
jgi:Tol biopolymer transport system component